MVFRIIILILIVLSILFLFRGWVWIISRS